MQQQIEDRNGLALGASGIARGGNQQGKLVEGRRQHVSDRLDHLSGSRPRLAAARSPAVITAKLCSSSICRHRAQPTTSKSHSEAALPRDSIRVLARSALAQARQPARSAATPSAMYQRAAQIVISQPPRPWTRMQDARGRRHLGRRSLTIERTAARPRCARSDAPGSGLASMRPSRGEPAPARRRRARSQGFALSLCEVSYRPWSASSRCDKPALRLRTYHVVSTDRLARMPC